MLAGNRVCVSTIFLIFMVFYPHTVHAQKFESADFLTWKRESQEFYIRTSVGMAGLIAAQNNKKHADCLEDWFWEDEKKSTDHILSVMRKYPEYHPRGVILAVLEKRCGEFDYINQSS